jgi:tRNA dimethylallyltransferase
MSSYLNSLHEDNEKRHVSSSESIQQQRPLVTGDTDTASKSIRPLVIVLAGPTAVGKSDVAAELCSSEMATDIIFHHQQVQSHQNENARLKTRGHVVSADSVQVYRGVDIGANKPSAEERKRTPHHLVDIVDPPNHDIARAEQDSISSATKASSYNAADWMRDAEYIIRKLTLFELGDNDRRDDEICNTLDQESSTRRECINAVLDNSQDTKNPILPVVVGGTMMYLQWLVHGRPDAIRPTNEAVRRATNVISSFQTNSEGTCGLSGRDTDLSNADGDANSADESAWLRASTYVSSLGPVFAARVSKLCGRDWYRLRRLLEVAYTISQSKMKLASSEAGCNANDENTILRNLTDSEIYTGIRSGSLSDAGFDVRCFFLCPNERMVHFHTVDKRCEEMLMRGLLRETATLYLSGGLPEDSQVRRAIGYRQTLDYLLRKDAKMGDYAAFLSFVDDFATATRQYAKKQMQWFRKDTEFAFIPIDIECNKTDRVKKAARLIADMCQLSRRDFDAQISFNGHDNQGEIKNDCIQLPISAVTKIANEEQGKGMKFFISKREKLVLDSTELKTIVADTDKYVKMLRK